MHQNLPNTAVHLEDDLAPLRDGLSRLRERAGRRDREVRGLVDQLILATAEAERRISEQRARISYLEGLSNSDELTGLLNRRGFHLALGAALARAQRHGETGILVLCDLDRFKAINDRHGHLAGDRVLCSVAALLRKEIRRSDAVARIGGDEFAILMSDTRRSQAADRLLRLEARIRDLEVSWQSGRLQASASFGAAAYNAGSSAEGLLFLADQALYADKRPKLVLGGLAAAPRAS
ncbi:MAG: GGDEF domain-containing protein [Kiloniellales bacterium]|nr:GGDEF domain-containing protein [Kiloniellales bacterium]